MALSALVQPLSIVGQVVIQTSINVQQAREALEQARESEAEHAINNPNPERAPVEQGEGTGADASSDGGGEQPNRGDAVNVTA